jgi:hypothetical protein
MAASRPLLVAMAADVPHFFGNEAVVSDFCTLLRVSRCTLFSDLFRFYQIFKVANSKFPVAAFTKIYPSLAVMIAFLGIRRRAPLF